MRTSEQIRAEIEEKFGFFPPFFVPAQHNAVLENLWQQTLSAYINNPLPTLFKEKLFAYLSRYCVVPYCVVCHSCSLRALGMEAQEVLKLLESPPPIAEMEIDQCFRALASQTTSTSLFDGVNEENLIYCSAFIFLGKDISGYYQREMQCLLGTENYQYLITFIAYIKMCHTWIEAHTEVGYGYLADRRAQEHLAVLLEEPNLADFFDQYQARVTHERQSQIEQLAEIAKRKQEQALIRVRAVEVANQELETELTDYKQALAALNRTKEILQESEARFRGAFDDAAVGMALVALSGNWLQVNRSMCEIIGYSEPELLATNFQTITHPDDLNRDLDYVRQVLAGEIRSYQMEKRYFHKQGQIIWVLLNVSLVRDLQSTPLYFVSQIQDITVQKQALDALKESEARWQLALRGNNDGIWDWNVKTNQVFFSVRWKAMLGYKDDEIANHLDEWTSRVHPDDSEDVTQLIQNHFAKRSPYYICEYRFLCKDGSYKWILDRGQALWDDAGKPVRMVGSSTDITKRKQAEAALKQANAQLTNLVNDLEQRHREMALLSEMSDILQACLTVEEAYRAIAAIIPRLFPETHGAIFWSNASKNSFTAVSSWGLASSASYSVFTQHECWALRRGRSHFVNDTQTGLRCQHLNHDASLTQSLCVPMMAQGEASGVLHIRSSSHPRLTDQQQLALTVAEHLALSLANLKLRETLHDQSIRDALTGLFNRRYMNEALKRELYRCDRASQPLAIIMIDIDHFKNFNDTFGHDAGDLVLQELAQFLQSHVRKSDIACRYGGEELILILPETSLEIARHRAEQLRQGAKQLQIQYNQQTLEQISLSLGVACFPKHGNTAVEVMRAADRALYHAKTTTRDRVVTFDSYLT